jgi:hypothetical protein
MGDHQKGNEVVAALLDLYVFAIISRSGPWPYICYKKHYRYRELESRLQWLSTAGKKNTKYLTTYFFE